MEGEETKDCIIGCAGESDPKVLSIFSCKSEGAAQLDIIERVLKFNIEFKPRHNESVRKYFGEDGVTFSNECGETKMQKIVRL